MNSFEIYKIIKNDKFASKNFIGVFARDQLPKKIKFPSSFIINTDKSTELRMGAEDFGYYSQKIPGCFFRLGTRNEAKGITIGVHTPTFNIDEDAIELGIKMMAFLGTNLDVNG